MSLDLIIKFLLNFLKLISFAIIEIKSLIKKITFIYLLSL